MFNFLQVWHYIYITICYFKFLGTVLSSLSESRYEFIIYTLISDVSKSSFQLSSFKFGGKHDFSCCLVSLHYVKLLLQLKVLVYLVSHQKFNMCKFPADLNVDSNSILSFRSLYRKSYLVLSSFLKLFTATCWL